MSLPLFSGFWASWRAATVLAPDDIPTYTIEISFFITWYKGITIDLLYRWILLCSLEWKDLSYFYQNESDRDFGLSGHILNQTVHACLFSGATRSSWYWSSCLALGF